MGKRKAQSTGSRPYLWVPHSWIQPTLDQKYSVLNFLRGAVETNLASNSEVVGSIPGLARWVKDPPLP